MKKIITYFLLIVGTTGCNLMNATGSFEGSSGESSLAVPHAQLNWTASTGSPLGYYIEQSTDGTNFTQIQTVTTTSATVTGLTAGETYYFRIRAYNADGDSAYTSIQSVTIPSDST